MPGNLKSSKIVVTSMMMIMMMKMMNKRDTIIRDDVKGTCIRIDVAVSGDRNVIKKVAEKVLKYKHLTIEI